MNNIITISLNMVKRIIGSRRGILTFIILPSVVLAGVVSISGGMGENPAIVLYTNMDNGAGGKHLLAELESTGDYKLLQKSDEAVLKESIIGQTGEAGVMIPAGYTSELLAGKQPQISIYELKTSETSIMVKMKTNAIADEMLSTATLIRSADGGSIDPEAQFAAILAKTEQHSVGSIRTDYNLYPREGLGVVVGLTLMFLMGLVTSSVSIIMDDRRGRTMMRMFSAPVRSYEIALGNFLGSFMVGLIQIIVVLTLGRWVLHYDYEIPLYLYFLVLAAFMLVSMGIASTVAGLVRNPNNAGMLNMLILTPTCMLGGCFWPLAIMPDYMQKAANFVPQKWAIQAVDIAATGGGWNELWLPFAILGLMAAVLLAIGSAILRPSEAGISA
ncbi:ABC transporter permease [Paenibacillus monticola]|uniref:ABC transporter permease subunit n=1 Tax=Paenibacillus monticola TaxID=2666075 RepID=A0A7X2L1Z1_9BACL|nr:ABC transporter permease [Paenibacillus monticola]MRN54322.1 ABC transporter permease subunit [Paenibacillus monticola]